MPNFGIGDIVTVRGYGGYAEVIGMEEDGVTPQGHPKYLCTVRFGIFEENETIRNTNLPFGPVRKPGVPRDRVHQFYAGRLTNILGDDEDPLFDGKSPQGGPKRTAAKSEEARKAELNEILIEMALLEAELKTEGTP
jgi:hypothetical protein